MEFKISVSTATKAPKLSESSMLKSQTKKAEPGSSIGEYRIIKRHKSSKKFSLLKTQTQQRSLRNFLGVPKKFTVTSKKSTQRQSTLPRDSPSIKRHSFHVSKTLDMEDRARRRAKSSHTIKVIVVKNRANRKTSLEAYPELIESEGSETDESGASPCHGGLMSLNRYCRTRDRDISERGISEFFDDVDADQSKRIVAKEIGELFQSRNFIERKITKRRPAKRELFFPDIHRVKKMFGFQ